MIAEFLEYEFDGKMKIDAQAFAQIMVSFFMNMIVVDDPNGKGKMKVLTSDRATKAGAIDPGQQITNEELRHRLQIQNSQNENKEVSRPRVTTKILLNKWQWERECHQRQKYYEDKNSWRNTQGTKRRCTEENKNT